ncbi:ATP-binding cassette domain-containing protein [Staphylococcus delphini]|uniref:ATP-binding cassette domain-containing protein n=1 Tax=Staphylococcus delphini TaxID=53344 RepID=UPI0021D00E3A|nr:ATP-binding cassette domain-containing protein [Staphylococcus delphini]UXS21656.1 ATP-binding cassette domain-containing protein [Staphylococcus delphini]UXS57600.1 ATP-binding cassette domain-containing protein [Staphylococcus delphini]
MIEILNLNLKIEDNVDIQITECNVYWLQGPNGSGKTTLFKILSGLYNKQFESSDNTINFYINENIVSLNEFKNITNFIPSEPYLFEYLTGQQNIDYLIELFDLNHKRELIMELVNSFNLNSSLNKMVKDYSLGMKAQLYLSVSIYREKKLHLIDEIINSLDNLSQKNCFLYFQQKLPMKILL